MVRRHLRVCQQLIEFIVSALDIAERIKNRTHRKGSSGPNRPATHNDSRRGLHPHTLRRQKAPLPAHRERGWGEGFSGRRCEVLNRPPPPPSDTPPETPESAPHSQPAAAQCESPDRTSRT